jgi:hypothetical protein
LQNSRTTAAPGEFLRELPAIISKFVRTGRLRIEYRSFKTNTIESEMFVKQQAAALAAGAQDKLWNYAYTFYHEQGKERTPYATESYLENIARQVPALDIKRWDRDRIADPTTIDIAIGWPWPRQEQAWLERLGGQGK